MATIVAGEYSGKQWEHLKLLRRKLNSVFGAGYGNFGAMPVCLYQIRQSGASVYPGEAKTDKLPQHVGLAD